MLASFLLVRSALITLFVPFDLWISSKLMGFYGVSAIANQELLAFFLSPAGFLLSLWFVTQLSFAFFVEQSAISILLAQHDLGKRSILDTFGLIIQRSFRVVKVVLAQSIGISLLFATLVWCGRWIYGLMLNDWDINYYLSNQMSSLWIAVGLLILITLPSVLLVLRYWASWWLALPLSLFQNCSQWQLFKQAQRLSQAIYMHIVIGHIVWLFGRVAITAIFAGSILFALEPILHWATSDPDRYPWLVFASLLLLGVTILLSFIDRFIYASCQYYVLRLQTKRLKLVNDQDRFVGLKQSTQRRALLSSAMFLFIVFATFNGYSDVSNFVKHLQTDTSGYVTAHRGGGFKHPENSEAGIQYSISLGIQSTEIDVQVTKDGKIVVFHDRDLGRLLGAPLVVEDANYSEIVAAYQENNRIAPPLLSQLLDHYAQDIEFNIELKRYNQSFELALAIAELLPNYQQAMIVSSLDVELLARLMSELKAKRPEQLRYALIYAASVGEAEIEREVDMLMVSDQWLNAWRIIEIQQREQEVLVWTINNSAAMKRLFLLGVDGIITDEPKLALDTKSVIEEMDFSDRALLTLRYWLSL
ncbi:glycerophosphodiester phosphodiesterase [Photobacterium minamisatsumaniensis]|uniref:glycerophosphodiester phosphodiesterase n=1 Tax=Photobacterium minamisatsumaniensis TaxID=2910233 RepID=UPI003D1110FF